MTTRTSKPAQDFSLEVMTYAPFSLRVIARVIDMIIVGGLWYGLTQLLLVLMKHEQVAPFVIENTIKGIVGGSVVVFCIFYMPLMEFYGGTIGKRIVGIKLLDAGTLNPPDFMNCFGRGLVYLVFCVLLFAPAIASCLAVLISAKNQTWHDLVSNVVVVKKSQI